MLATKKKGYALIYAMCAVMIISALMMAILSLTLSNRTTTASYEKTNKARLLAEEGMESAVKTLKTHIADNFAEYIDVHDTSNSTQFNITGLTAVTQTNSDGSSYSYKFAEGTHDDNTSGKTGANAPQCIVITGTGIFQGITKTITAYVAENDISNIYYDKMFTHPVTQDANTPKISITASISDTASKKFETTPDSITGNPYIITMKRDYDTLTADGLGDNTLSALTDEMYTQITTDPTINFKNIIIPTETMTKLAPIQSYLDSITSIDGNNYVKDMLRFSTFYKVIFVHVPATEVLQVGKMKDPLVNYIIYCDGTINIQPDSNLKLWNCNIYANAITYNGEPTKFSYAENSTDVAKVVEDPDPNPTKLTELAGNPKNVDVTSEFDFKGIGSQGAKMDILKYILADEITNTNNPYSTYETTQSDPTSVFAPAMAGKFSETDRVKADTDFYSYIDGYAYGLKLRYIDIKFN